MLVDLYSIGVVYVSACAPTAMERSDVEAAVNAQAPTGLDHDWRVADEPFRSGAANPSPCENDADRQHWLLNC